VVHWGILTLAFVYLSVDETAILHEILIVAFRRRLGSHGFLYALLDYMRGDAGPCRVAVTWPEGAVGGNCR